MRITFAPLITAITSIIKDGISLSFILRFISFPRKDLFDREIQMGKENFVSSFRLETISISRQYHGVVIFVKNGLLPSFLKKPIDGSIMILVL